MNRVILHIGMERTGSSALQRYFARNRTVLRVMGVRYPQAEAAGVALEKHQDLVDAIATSARGELLWEHGSAAEVLASYVKRAERSANTVISAEGLSAPDPVFAHTLAPLAQQFDVRVIVFLRRQDEWAVSSYRNAVNTGTVGGQSIVDWLADPQTRARMDYRAILRFWEEAFGADAITVLRYPHDVPLVPAFLAAADLPKAAGVLPDAGLRVNESSSDTDLREAMARAGLPPVVPDLDQDQRDALLEDYADGNAEIRRRYLSQRRTLFGVA
ncbi:MAG: hypothetical protein AAGA19_00420 [Pseudomonadota bacterium]